MPTDDDTPQERNLIHHAGADIYFTLMINTLITSLIQSRALDPAVFRENVDAMLLGVEGKVTGPGSKPKAYRNAQDRLQRVVALLDKAQSVADPGAAG